MDAFPQGDAGPPQDALTPSGRGPSADRPGGFSGWVGRMARARWVYPVLATLLTYIFWWSSLTKIVGFEAATAEMAQFGLNPPAAFAALTIAVQLLGAVLVICGGRLVWLGAGMLIVMTLGTVPVAHRYWQMTGIQAILEQAIVQEHFSVIGGLLLAVVAAELRRKAKDT